MDYLPSSDEAFDTWMQTFITNLLLHSGELGIDPLDVAPLQNDRDAWAHAVGRMDQAKTYSQQYAAFKRGQRYGDGPAPAAPVVAADGPGDPAPVAEGIERRFREMARQVKASAGYTEAIGESLGIIAPDAGFDPELGKPELDLRLVGGGLVEVRWKRGKYEALRIELDTGAGFSLLAVDTKPHYTDTTPAPAAGASQLRKYRAVYLMDDQPAGQWSDTAEIAVPGA
jgi:hypothetical protein